MQTELSVFHFRDPIEYLNFALKSRQQKNENYSLRAWARELGYENPSYLSHILKRNRKLKMNVAQRLAKNLALNAKERKYFELLAMEHSSESETERHVFHKMIGKMKPSEPAPIEEQPIEKFELATEWYHWALLEMFFLKGFIFTVENVSARLGITPAKVADSLKRLTALGFVKKSAEGEYRRADGSPVFWKNFPGWALAAMHRTAIEHARKSIDDFPPEMLNLRVTRIALSWENFAKAGEIILEAHKKIMALPKPGEAEEVFQFSSQLHPLTLHPKAAKNGKNH